MNSSHNRPAFTMIEVLAALAILSIALVVLIKSQTQSISNVRRVSTYERAVFNTENQLHWTFLELGQIEDWEELHELSGEESEFRWQVLINEVEHEDSVENKAILLQIVATTTWREGRGQSSFRLESRYLWGERL